MQRMSRPACWPCRAGAAGKRLRFPNAETETQPTAEATAVTAVPTTATDAESPLRRRRRPMRKARCHRRPRPSRPRRLRRCLRWKLFATRRGSKSTIPSAGPS